ncbi:2-hydroxychromene-2-carboxylate isomerase [Sphingomonas sp.]|uniref:2-hydroxychromene-2-carboxylate isomerase n=1 Tax=Sphingomonas sp. TaxID=28214 RepID=UPI00286E8AF1|nr:2-hydroxychromene-2-carboxylate isomerase [Sphingomonas sp.]
MDATFYFDVGSPNAYLAHRVVPGIEQRTGARFDYVPVLLGGLFKATGNQSPLTAYAAIPAKLAYEGREIERFVARHGLAAFRFNPHFPINTLGLMRGAVAAGVLDVFEPYVEAVFVAMWEDGRDMADAAVVAEVLGAAGLPAAELLALAQDDGVKAGLAANTQRAVEDGVFGVPSFVVGGELYFGKDRLGQVEEALLGS